MRFIIAAFLGLVLATSAYAGANVKQKGTGATVWIDKDSKEWPVGDSGLTVEISDVSVATTSYVVSHRPGIITKVYAVLHGTIADTLGGRFRIIHGTDGDASFNAVSTADAANRLEVTSGNTPNYGSWVPTSPEADRTIAQGDIIGIVSDGNMTAQNAATFVIVIE